MTRWGFLLAVALSLTAAALGYQAGCSVQRSDDVALVQFCEGVLVNELERLKPQVEDVKDRTNVIRGRV